MFVLDNIGTLANEATIALLSGLASYDTERYICYDGHRIKIHGESYFEIILADNYKTKIWLCNGLIHCNDGPAMEIMGTKYWYREGKLHREDGPAIEWANGSEEWWLNGERNQRLLRHPEVITSKTSKRWMVGNKLHREDGPAIEYNNGSKEWYFDGKLHRTDGPAIEQSNGTKYWYLNGQLHREDGPAIEYAYGDKEWYLNGKRHREDGPAIEYHNGHVGMYYINGIYHSKADWTGRKYL